MSRRQLVVGAAIIRHGCVLAARRTSPAAAAGRWEFPGGKVEPGETPEAALVREVAEELRCDIRVTGWLPGRIPAGDRHELAVAVARLVRGDPAPTEHDLIRWLTPEELGDVDWLEPDRPFLTPLRQRMAARVRAIFHEEADAAAAAERLHRGGHDAHAYRDRLAGEDDDEDHPWAVATDAPAAVLEPLLEEYDGWLDAGGPSVATPPPLELPTSPRRHHRPRGD